MNLPLVIRDTSSKAVAPLDIVHHHLSDAFNPLFNLIRGVFSGPQPFQQKVDLADYGRHRVAQLVCGNGNEGVTSGHCLDQLSVTVPQVR